MIELKRKSFDRDECLSQYKHHIVKVRGLARTTERAYLLIAQRFLECISKTPRIYQSRINSRSVIDFVRADAAERSGQGPTITVSATKSFLRFLIVEGIVAAGLDAAVPRLRCYRHTSLPSSLSQAEIKQLLVHCRDGSARGTRNYALVMVLSRLGLRIDEVARLSLEDFDWRNGFVIIRAGKNRCERKLPLAEDVAKAILRYLRNVRPQSTYRNVFLHWLRPYKGYCGDSLGKIIHRLLETAGLKRELGGPHQFRHSAATLMVNRGASFKEIADLLGHQSLLTTGIYAKLDFNTLTSIALPWSEVSHD